MMKTKIVALVSGVIFGFGLCLSRMVNPRVVIGFLDVAGVWDPSLAFVMTGALSVTFVTFRFILKRERPVCGHEFFVPATKTVDTRLIAGAALFGIGWGLAGICPGPAVTALVFGLPGSFIFAASMLAGMGIYQWLQNR